jgi:hypothetical protein
MMNYRRLPMTRRQALGIMAAPFALRGRVGLRGFGAAPTLNYYDLLAQANLQSCDPKDSACVSNNVAKQAAVEDLWVNRYMVSGAPAGTQLTFTPQTTAQTTEFHDPLGIQGNVVDTSGIMTVSGGAGGQGAAPYVPPVVKPVVKAPAVVAGGSTAGSASGGGVPSASLPVITPGVLLAANGSTGGFSLSSLPWWVWAGGAAFGLYAMKGKG